MKQQDLLQAIAQNSANWAKILNMSANAFSNLKTGKSKLLSKHYQAIRTELDRQLKLLDELEKTKD